MSVLGAHASKLRSLSPTELYLYVVGQGLFGIGVGALAARLFANFAPEIIVGGITAGLVMVIVGGKAMFRRVTPH